jgi:hypothetical protein
MASETKRVANPEDAPNIKSFTLEKTYHRTMKQYADAAGTSVSAVARQIIEDYLDVGVTMLTKEPTIRTSVWVPADLWEAFRLKTEENEVTMSDVLRAGIVQLDRT